MAKEIVKKDKNAIKQDMSKIKETLTLVRTGQKATFRQAVNTVKAACRVGSNSNITFEQEKLLTKIALEVVDNSEANDVLENTADAFDELRELMGGNPITETD